MKYFVAIGLFFIFLSTNSIAQNRKDVSKAPKDRYQEVPSSRDPGSSATELSAEKQKGKAEKASSRKRRFNYTKYYDQKVKEYEQRMEAAAKRYKKMQKELQKPQYSDPSYFGHKRKPKKRPPGKKKFCKECGIVH
ncbi:MAG: hypothetical protein ACNS62_19655 [Candidatus Cyclobacteriaceae bacterium M3_2C_046]